jgi:hypothetical protein
MEVLKRPTSCSMVPQFLFTGFSGHGIASQVYTFEDTHYGTG